MIQTTEASRVEPASVGLEPHDLCDPLEPEAETEAGLKIVDCAERRGAIEEDCVAEVDADGGAGSGVVLEHGAEIGGAKCLIHAPNSSARFSEHSHMLCPPAGLDSDERAGVAAIWDHFHIEGRAAIEIEEDAAAGTDRTFIDFVKMDAGDLNAHFPWI